jgi:centrin-1
MRANSKPVNKTVVTTTVVTTTKQSTRSNSKPVAKTTVVNSNSKPSSRSNSKQVAKTTVVTSTSKPTSRSNSKQASKPASKAPSQVPSKKVEIKKVVISSDDGDEIKNAFEFFDSNGNGKIDAREVRNAMQKIGYDENNPTVYEVVTELDNPRNKNTGVTFDDFVKTVNYKVPEKETLEDLRKVFNLFLDDPNSNTTSLESIKRVADELGENIEEVELNAMLNKASKSGARLTFDDFVALMTGNNL